MAGMDVRVTHGASGSDPAQGNGGLCAAAADPVCFWNDQLLKAAYRDSRKPQDQQEQGGPIRVARAGAIVHAAIHDALNGVEPAFEPYLVRERAVREGRLGEVPTAFAAIGAAAYATLAWLYPTQAGPYLSPALLGYFGGTIPFTDPGFAYGAGVGGAYIVARQNDGSARWDAYNSPAENPRDPEDDLPAEAPYRQKKTPGEWRTDPLDIDPHGGPQNPVGPGWGTVRPFTFGGGSTFRVGPYPRPNTPQYVAGHEDVRIHGDVKLSTPATRAWAFFWSYDDQLGTPIRLFNRAIWAVLASNPAPTGGPVTTLHAHARLFALANLAMADAGIVTRDVKYGYNLWRPTEGIRRANQLEAIYGHPLHQDAHWTPVGRPRNASGRLHTTPPFPAYTSGHSAFGAATFAILADIFGTDTAHFTLSTEEEDIFANSGSAVVPAPTPAPIAPIAFSSFAGAADHCGRSRILLGVHWTFDDEQGKNLGRKVARNVFEGYLRRVSPA